jgi:hypothetical protein
MIEIPRDAPGSVACDRSGLPLLAVCPRGHRRLVPFRLQCRACGSREVTLFSIDGQAELDAIQRALAGPPQPARAPTTHRARDPNADFA